MGMNRCSRCGTGRSPNWHGSVQIICCSCFQELEQREQTILKNLPLVHWICNRLARDGAMVLNLERCDAVAFGVLGLIAAVDNYDPARGSFASYASLRIKGAVLDAVRANDPLGRAARQAVRDLDAAVQELAGENGCSPSHQQIAEALGISVADVARIERDADLARAPFEEEWAGAAEPDLDPAWAAQRSEDATELQRAMARLPDREGVIVELYYRQHLPFRVIGEMLGLSESRICGLHRRALLRLREALAGRAA